MWHSLTRFLWGGWILGKQIGFGKNLICLLASTEVLYVFFPLWLYLSLMAMVQGPAVSSQSHCSLVSNLCRKKKYLDLISSKTQPLFLTFEDEQAWGTTRLGCFRKHRVSFWRSFSIRPTFKNTLVSRQMNRKIYMIVFIDEHKVNRKHSEVFMRVSYTLRGSRNLQTEFLARGFTPTCSSGVQ